MAELDIKTPTMFTKTFGSVPAIRIIDFLIENRRDSWSMTEIAKQGGIAYPSVKHAIPALLDSGIIISTRKVGRIPLYAISESIAAKKLLELHSMVTLQSKHSIGAKNKKLQKVLVH